jgi:hypothetical protein
MRGSYGGVLMFGLITTFVGLSLLNPISIGAGVLLGTKAYKEDKENRVKARRSEAKMAIRRFTDDVSFQPRNTARPLKSNTPTARSSGTYLPANSSTCFATAIGTVGAHTTASGRAFRRSIRRT